MTAAPPSPLRPAARSREGGFVLVTVLWILAALAAFVGVYALYVGNTAAAAAARDEALAARSLATGAVEMAAFRLVSVPKDRRPTQGVFTYRMGRARITVVFQEESARIDLNAAPRELLVGLFTTLGAQERAAEGYADRILGWRQPASGGAVADERAVYQDAQLPYGPRAAPFVHADELWRVAGIPPAMVAAAMPHVTVFSGRPRVNVSDADPLVQAAVAAAPKQVESVAGQAAPPPPAPEEPSEAVRVSVRVAFDSGVTRAFEAVILVREFVDAPFRMLAWREDVVPVRTALRTGLEDRP